MLEQCKYTHTIPICSQPKLIFSAFFISQHFAFIPTTYTTHRHIGFFLCSIPASGRRRKKAQRKTKHWCAHNHCAFFCTIPCMCVCACARLNSFFSFSLFLLFPFMAISIKQPSTLLYYAILRFIMISLIWFLFRFRIVSVRSFSLVLLANSSCSLFFLPFHSVRGVCALLFFCFISVPHSVPMMVAKQHWKTDMISFHLWNSLRFGTSIRRNHIAWIRLTE